MGLHWHGSVLVSSPLYTGTFVALGEGGAERVETGGRRGGAVRRPRHSEERSTRTVQRSRATTKTKLHHG